MIVTEIGEMDIVGSAKGMDTSTFTRVIMTNDLFNKMTPEQEETEIQRVTSDSYMDKELREVANETIKELELEIGRLTTENTKLEDNITDLERQLMECEQRMDKIRELAW